VRPRERNRAKGGVSVAEQKPPSDEKRDEFQAFKSLTRKLVAVRKSEVKAAKPLKRRRAK
jgi:hypothetical protein